MALTKQFLKSKPICNVTFKLPKSVADGASTVHLVGDFNDWDMNATAMKPLKSGDFSVKLPLETGRNYQFRYLLDGQRWENDDAPDGYEFNAFAGAENSVISL